MTSERALLRPADHQDPSWPTSLFILLVVAQPAASMLASGLFDSVTTVIDSSWRHVTTVEGNAGRNTKVLFAVAISALSVHLILQSLGRPAIRVNLLAAAGSLGALLHVSRGADSSEALGSLVYILAIWAAAVSRPRHQAVRWLGWFALFFYLSNWLFFLGGNPSASKSCRDDKCSYLGVLLEGYTQHEQTLALYGAMLLPALVLLRPSLRWSGVILAFGTGLATGSRTGLLAMLVAVFALWLLRELREQPEDSWRIVRSSALVRAAGTLPVVSLAAASVLFLVLPSAALTGRGQIWQLVRDDVLTSPLLGPGRGVLDRAYAVGDIDFMAWTEHNQAGYLLAVGGVVVFLLFGWGLLQMTVAGRHPQGRAALLFMVAPSLGLATEVVWSFDLLTGSTAWTLVLCVLLQPLRTVDGPTAEDRSAAQAWRDFARSRAVTLPVAATVGALAAGAWVAAQPRTYEAQASLFVTVSRQEGEVSLETAHYYSQRQARSYAQAIVSPAVVGPALRDIRSGADPVEVADSLGVVISVDTVVVRITVPAGTAAEAAVLARAIADQAVRQLADIDPNLLVTSLGGDDARAGLASTSLRSAASAGAVMGLLTALLLPGRRSHPGPEGSHRRRPHLITGRWSWTHPREWRNRARGVPRHRRVGERQW